MEFLDWLFSSFLFIFFLGITLWTYKDYKNELKLWNNGICEKTGKPWAYVNVKHLSNTGFTYKFWDGDSDFEWFSCNPAYEIVLKELNKTTL